MTTFLKTLENDDSIRILCLDGGGSKGFYSLGVLKELEGMLDDPLHKSFDLIYGTSTGAIIASLIALGYDIDAIHSLYTEHVPNIMRGKNAKAKSRLLEQLAREVFGDRSFNDFQTNIGIITTRWATEKPMIFKSNISQAHGRKGTFIPGFGISIADAVQASCSAYPFFERKIITTSTGDIVELIDGGYCANNPTLYAIADVTAAMNKRHSDIKIVSIGVGTYPEPKPSGAIMRLVSKLLSVQLLKKTLEINTQSMDQLRSVLFKDVETIRVNDTFSEPSMATDLMEHQMEKLNILYQCGRNSFASHEKNLRYFWSKSEVSKCAP